MKWLVTLSVIPLNAIPLRKKNEIKYLVLDDIDENKEVLKKYEEVWEGIKKEIETINSGEKIEYGKDFKKIRFESNDDLPLNKYLVCF